MYSSNDIQTLWFTHKDNSAIQVISVRSNQDMQFQYSDLKHEQTLNTSLCNGRSKNSHYKKYAPLLESYL